MPYLRIEMSVTISVKTIRQLIDCTKRILNESARYIYNCVLSVYSWISDWLRVSKASYMTAGNFPLILFACLCVAAVQTR